MTTTRRQFAKVLSSVGTAFVFANTLAISACNVFTDILKYIPVGLQGFMSVIDLLSGNGVINPVEGTAIDVLINIVKAGFADLAAATESYNNAPAADKATLKGKLALVLADVQASIQQFWGDVHIPDPKLAQTVQGLLGLILSTLAGFGISLPVPAVKSTRVMKVEALGNRITFTPKKRTQAEFKKEFNAIGSPYKATI